MSAGVGEQTGGRCPGAAVAPLGAGWWAGRRRLPLAFAAAATAIIIGSGLIIGLTATGPAEGGDAGGDFGPVAVAVTMAGLALATLGALWWLVQRSVIEAARTLAAEARVASHGGPGAHIRTERFVDLEPLPAAFSDLVDKMLAARRDIDIAVATSTAQVGEQNSRLSAILRDLHEGVLVCNLKHQILLYNQTALRLLHWMGELGLGRSLLQVMLPEPIVHTLERLMLLAREGQTPTAVEETAQFVGASIDGRVLLQGRMSLIVQADAGPDTGPDGHPETYARAGGNGHVTGYVVTFSDATQDLIALAQRDTLLREATEGFRPPIANLRAMLETLADSPELSLDARQDFELVMMQECNLLADRLEHISAEYLGAVAGSWPMSDLHSSNLINLVGLRVSARRGHTVTPTGLPQWLHGDSYSLVVLLDHLIDRLARATRVRTFDLSAEAAGQWIYIDIGWPDTEPLAAAEIDGWKGQPLTDSLGGLTVGDVLQRHRSDLWSERWRDGYVRLRLPLPRPRHPHVESRRLMPPRPEFFDFSLLDQPLATSELRGKLLSDLLYVVFDTETTGLWPSEGDEIISVAAVRIVNGRILTGETFVSLINPRRPIRPETIPIHGITEDMLRNRPGAEVALPQFHAFCADAVLVAHNAAFDLKFLKLKEPTIGVRFSHPVLDTMLLSLMLQGEGGDHSLDGIAERLGIQVIDRHTALGDSLLTAAVFLRMLEMLKERNILTLDDALKGANIAMELHARQQAF